MSVAWDSVPEIKELIDLIQTELDQAYRQGYEQGHVTGMTDGAYNDTTPGYRTKSYFMAGQAMGLYLKAFPSDGTPPFPEFE